MSGRNWGSFFYNNVVFLTGIPMIIGIHYGWWKIQQNPDLVDPKDRRELPLYSIYKKLYKELLGDSSSESASSVNGQTKE